MLNMQRQSLGTPSSKHHLHINGEEKKTLEIEEEMNGKDRIVVEEERKVAAKLHHHHRSSFRIKKSIHLIPILTIFCFLVLYLVSYDPVQKDLVHINGFVRSSKKIDSSAMIDVALERYLEVNKGDVLAIRSHRSLQEVEKKKKFRGSGGLHRKFGDF